MGNIRIALLLFLVPIILFGCSKGENQANHYTSRPLSYGTVIGTIIESENGKPVPARVYAIGSNDSVYMADKCLPYDRPNFGSRIGYSGRHFTTIGNTFTVHLPHGPATITIERGKEYIPIEEEVYISAGKTVKMQFNISRWIDMTSKGWYSGDLHVHRRLNNLADLMLAEDLNVALPQTNWNSSQEPGLDQWIEKADNSGAIKVDNLHVFSVFSSEIERFNHSALLMHHTGRTVIPVGEYHENGFPNVDLIEKTHETGGYADVEKPMWPESHIDVAVGKADFIGLANNHNTYKSYLPEHPRLRTEFKNDYPEGEQGYVQYVFDLYYAFLNCGFKVMPSAGSASGVLPNPLGYNRVYVKIDGEFTYDNWFKSLKAGRSFVTNGPILIMTVEGKQMGETVNIKGQKAHIVCEIHSYKPIERLEIIQDGECIHTEISITLSDYYAVVESDIPFSESE